MIRVEFIQGFKCYQKGDIRTVQPHFAHVLIEQGIAKVVRAPPKHKMMEGPEMAKGNISI